MYINVAIYCWTVGLFFEFKYILLVVHFSLNIYNITRESILKQLHGNGELSCRQF